MTLHLIRGQVEKGSPLRVGVALAVEELVDGALADVPHLSAPPAPKFAATEKAPNRLLVDAEQLRHDANMVHGIDCHDIIVHRRIPLLETAIADRQLFAVASRDEGRRS